MLQVVSVTEKPVIIFLVERVPVLVCVPFVVLCVWQTPVLLCSGYTEENDYDREVL